MKLPQFLMLVSLFTSSCLCAQTKIIVHENTTQPTQQPTFSTRQPREKMKNGSPSTFFDISEAAIKINASAMISADYCLSFEKKITSNFSCEVTLGATHGDKIFEPTNFMNYRPKNMTGETRTHLTGASAKLAGRWYLNSEKEEIEGFYIGVEILYRKYNNVVVPKPPHVISIQSPTNETSIHKEIHSLFGWQSQNNFPFLDISGGLGYRVQSRTYVGWIDRNHSSAGALYNGSKGYFVAMLSLKIGISLDCFLYK